MNEISTSLMRKYALAKRLLAKACTWKAGDMGVTVIVHSRVIGRHTEVALSTTLPNSAQQRVLMLYAIHQSALADGAPDPFALAMQDLDAIGLGKPS